MDDCLLLQLPAEILKYIAGFLGPRDLIASSAACHTLRTAFNDDLIWRKYTDGGEISRRLDGVPSVVEPVYRPLELSTLDPLCQNREHFLKQSRLLHNLRHGKFVKHFVPFDKLYLSDDVPFPKMQTYADEYLFALVNHPTDYNTWLVRIFNIKSKPFLFMTLVVEKYDYYMSGHSTSIQVINNTLVVKLEYWIVVYQINLPQTNMPLLKTAPIYDLMDPVYELLVGHLLLYSVYSSNIVCIWNLETLNQCNDILPKINGTNLELLACSEDCIQVLLCSRMFQGSGDHLFVYNIETQSYSDFDVVFHAEGEFHGFIKDHFVILVFEKANEKCSVELFDVKRSVKIATKINIDFYSFKCVSIRNGFVFLPSRFRIIILNLTNLQTVYDLQFDTTSLIRRIPRSILPYVEYADFSKLCLLIIIGNNHDTEIWNFDSMTKVSVLHRVRGLSTRTISKLVICGSGGGLYVLSYW